MVSGSLKRVAAFSALSVVSALNIRDAVAGDGFVAVPVGPMRRSSNVLHRRAADGTAAIDINNFQTSGYTINDPAQETTVILDTGSLLLWVDPDCSKASRADLFKDSGESGVEVVDGPLTSPDYCEKLGRYDKDKSNTKTKVDEDSQTLTYADFTTVEIELWQDKLSIAGVTVNDQIFGVATSSNQTAVGIMGMGPPPFGFNNTNYYTLMLTNMAKQGLIKSRAFSLDLRDFDNTTGSLIFGGVDKGKYAGPLTKIPLETVEVAADDGKKQAVTSYWVKVTSMGLAPPGSKTQSKSYNLPNGGNFIADLDSGTGAILVPSGMAGPICADLNGTEVDVGAGQKTCTVDCAVRRNAASGGGLTVGFGGGGPALTISYSNLVDEIKEGGQTSCFLGVQDSTIVSDPPTYILGAPFLRSAYAVFDWDNANVHLAQAANCGTNIVSIGNGANAVPEDKGDCSSGASSVAANFGVMVAAAIVGILLAI